MTEIEMLRSKKRLTRGERDAIARKLESMEKDAALAEALREFARNLRPLQTPPAQLVPVIPTWPTWPSLRQPDYWQPTIICSSDTVIS